MAHAHAHVHTHGGHSTGLHDDHGHHHGDASGWRYALAILLNLGVVAVQFVMGLSLGSSALLADAGHNASDVLGLVLAGWAAWLMTRAGSPRRTYGFGKAGVLAALVNSLLLVFACGALVFEAVGRLMTPEIEAPPGGMVMLIAGIAVVLNLFSGWLLMGGHPDDVNRRAAVVHLFADAGVSVGVMVAGALILWTGARWIDPVASLLIVAVILVSTWKILVQSLDMAMDAAPSGIDVVAVKQWLSERSGVEAVHDLHIWPISATETALTAHLVVPADRADGLIEQVSGGLKSRFGIAHTTIQIERSDCDQCGEQTI
ncbi:cation diffusion facilitator family transporter [Sandaracinobacteroides hominis]|uniref:cation diffusion facilitator family transporter n=1 Tax=Sandaracinobacteroides hominis TaxID=2780086 RepID=UPI0018F49642|nr:cation diffusion facilitator family transporter [Sandaracinobacteroides hominis]